MRRLLPLALVVLALLVVAVGAQSGGLPSAGVEMLQLALLGLVLLLVGARLRVLAKRRWLQAAPGWGAAAPRPAPVRGTGRRPRYEWELHEPEEAPSTGTPPSTASARRRARVGEVDPSTVR